MNPKPSHLSSCDPTIIKATILAKNSSHSSDFRGILSPEARLTKLPGCRPFPFKGWTTVAIAICPFFFFPSKGAGSKPQICLSTRVFAAGLDSALPGLASPKQLSCWKCLRTTLVKFPPKCLLCQTQVKHNNVCTQSQFLPSLRSPECLAIVELSCTLGHIIDCHTHIRSSSSSSSSSNPEFASKPKPAE